MTEETHDALIKRFVAGDESAFYEVQALLNTPQCRLEFGVFWGISAGEVAAVFSHAFKLFSNPEAFKEKFEYAKQNISSECPPPPITQEEIEKHLEYEQSKADRNRERALLELGLNPPRERFIHYELMKTESVAGTDVNQDSALEHMVKLSDALHVDKEGFKEFFEFQGIYRRVIPKP